MVTTTTAAAAAAAATYHSHTLITPHLTLLLNHQQQLPRLKI